MEISRRTLNLGELAASALQTNVSVLCYPTPNSIIDNHHKAAYYSMFT